MRDIFEAGNWGNGGIYEYQPVPVLVNAELKMRPATRLNIYISMHGKFEMIC
jgi:hypothetical protein